MDVTGNLGPNLSNKWKVKYLGVELDQRLSWKELKERIAAKAKKNMTGMGMVQGNLSVKAAINVSNSS